MSTADAERAIQKPGQESDLKYPRECHNPVAAVYLSLLQDEKDPLLQGVLFLFVVPL
jgi:hypothetical protein